MQSSLAQTDIREHAHFIRKYKLNDNLFIDDCPACGARDWETTSLLLREGPLRRCRCCGHYVSSCSSGEYDETMREFENPLGTLPSDGSLQRRRVLIGRRLALLARLLNKPSQELRLLDVGCSSGALLRIASEAGFSVQGVEPSPAPAQTARDQGYTVHTGFLEQVGLPSDGFDIVTLMEVIEHLRQPLALFQEIRRVLRPGGLLMVSTGNAGGLTMRATGADWEYLDMARHGGHVSFFTPASMRHLSQRAELELVRVDTRNLRLVEKGRPGYRPAKILSELLAWPVACLGWGHDIVTVMRRPAT